MDSRVSWIYAIVWRETRHVGMVAAGMEGKRLAMMVLKVYSSLRLVSNAGTSSVYCDKTGRGGSNRICKIFGDICNHVEGTILF